MLPSVSFNYLENAVYTRATQMRVVKFCAVVIGRFVSLTRLILTRQVSPASFFAIPSAASSKYLHASSQQSSRFF